MERDVLQVFAGSYVTESDNITKEDKLKLVGFIKAADKSQILSLLTTGMMTESNRIMESQAALNGMEMFIENLVYEKVKMGSTGASPKQYYKKFAGQKLNVPVSKTGKGIAAAMVVAAAAAAAYAVYKGVLSKSARACKGASDRAACLHKFKMDGLKAQVIKLKSGAAKCASTKNPDKCRASIGKKAAKLAKKVSG